MSKYFHKKIAILLTLKDMNRSELARQIGSKVNTVQGYWQKKSIPSSLSMVKIAKIFGTTVEKLMRDWEISDEEESLIYNDIYTILLDLDKKKLKELHEILKNHR